jgi:hypothetical protein
VTVAPPGAPPAPGTVACPRCGTSIAPDQSWCLECGAPARTRLVPTPNWRAPAAVLAVVILLAGIALAVAFVALTNDNEPAPPVNSQAPPPSATTAQPPAAAQPAPTATAPAPTTAAPGTDTGATNTGSGTATGSGSTDTGATETGTTGTTSSTSTGQSSSASQTNPSG